MTKHSTWLTLLAASLVSATPVLHGRQDGEPPGSVLPLQSGTPPQPTTNPSLGTAANGKFQWQIYSKCDVALKKAIVRAWVDSKQFSDALSSWVPNGAYQPAMDMYMGTRSTYKDSLGYDFPQQIQNTAERHQGLYAGESSVGNATLWVYCNEDSFWWNRCKENDPGALIAYEFEKNNNQNNNWYITFCPAFFNSNYMLNFQDKLAQIKDQPSMNMDVINGLPGFQAGTLFHETMHMSRLVTSPQAKDYAYGAKNVYDLAKNNNTDAAVYNADSWTMVAQAIWAQKQYNLPNPPKPAAYTSNANASATGSYQLDVIYVDAAGVVPQGASPVSNDEYHVDTSIWQVYTPGQGLAPVGSSTSTKSGTPTPTPTKAPTCEIGSTQDIGPYCLCSSGSSTVTAKPLTSPPPGENECDYSTLPSGSQTLTAIYTSSSTQPTPTEAPAPYATSGNVGVTGAVNKCHVHVWETQDCETDTENLSAQIEIYDAAGHTILERTDSTSINNDNAGEFPSELPYSLRLTGEHENDYIQFNYGSTAWTSGTSDTSANAWCQLGGWSLGGGPICTGRFYENSIRQMDCYFPCPWNGGPSSG